MATLVDTQTDCGPDGAVRQVWTLYSDGSVTITNAQGATINVAPTAATIAQAQSFTAMTTQAVNRATIEQALAQALPGLASIDTQLQTLSTITLSGTTAQQLAQVQAALRGIGAGLDTVLAGLIKATRLLANQLDGTT